MDPHIFSPSVARARSLWQRLVRIENCWVILNWLLYLFFFPPQHALRSSLDIDAISSSLPISQQN